MSERNGTINTPAGNRIAIKVDIESAPRLLIDIVKFTDSSEGAMKMISLTFRNLHEVFDRHEEQAMSFVGCICVMCIALAKFDDVLVIPMNNDQMIMAEALLAACHPVGHDELVECAKQVIAYVARCFAVDYAVSVR